MISILLYYSKKIEGDFPLDDVIIKIKGMMCGHCEKTVTEAAESLKGVTKASSDFKKGEAIVSFDSSITDLETIKKAIMDAGYEVIDKDEACPLPVKSAVIEPRAKVVDKKGEIKKTSIKITGDDMRLVRSEY